jgi:hypothetical protein
LKPLRLQGLQQSNNKHEHKVRCVTQTQRVFFCTFIYAKVPFYLTTLNHMHFQERRAIKPALSAQGVQQSNNKHGW